MARVRFTAFCTTGSNSSSAVHNPAQFGPTQSPRQLQNLVLRRFVQHQRPSHEHPILTLRTRVDNRLQQRRGVGGGSRRVVEEAAIAMDELCWRAGKERTCSCVRRKGYPNFLILTASKTPLYFS